MRTSESIIVTRSVSGGSSGLAAVRRSLAYASGFDEVARECLRGHGLHGQVANGLISLRVFQQGGPGVFTLSLIARRIMKVLFRFLLITALALPLAACSSEPGDLNKNQDPSDPAAQTEHDLEGEPPPVEDAVN